MADYFEELNRTPLAEGETPNHLRDLVILLRDFGMFSELGETNRLPPPTSKAFLKESLPDIRIAEEDAKCSVCLKEFEGEESARRLPCKHEFHSACIMPWLEKTSTCPMCRHDLPTDDEQYEAYKKEKIREKQRGEELELLHNSMFS